MTNTATSTAHQLDIILIYAQDQNFASENAEICARLALDAAVKTGDTDANYHARAIDFVGRFRGGRSTIDRCYYRRYLI